MGKRCDVCNEIFNPHEEDTCRKCRDEIKNAAYEIYSNSLERLEAIEKAVYELRRSIEYYTYCENPKQMEQMDEYDLMMSPIWRELFELLGKKWT